jgi:hypothetical protein
MSTTQPGRTRRRSDRKAPALLQAAQSETREASPVMLLVEQKQGAQPHPAESRSKTRPTRSRREFCLFVIGEVSGEPTQVPWGDRSWRWRSRTRRVSPSPTTTPMHGRGSGLGRMTRSAQVRYLRPAPRGRAGRSFSWVRVAWGAVSGALPDRSATGPLSGMGMENSPPSFGR